jgi:hypothetical protein
MGEHEMNGSPKDKPAGITRQNFLRGAGAAAATYMSGGLVQKAFAADPNETIRALLAELQSSSFRSEVPGLKSGADTMTVCQFNNNWYQVNKEKLGLLWRYIQPKPESELEPEILQALTMVYGASKLAPQNRPALDAAALEQLDSGPKPSKCGLTFKMGFALVSAQQLDTMQRATILFMTGFAKHLQKDLRGGDEKRIAAEKLISTLSEVVQLAKKR